MTKNVYKHKKKATSITPDGRIVSLNSLTSPLTPEQKEKLQEYVAHATARLSVSLSMLENLHSSIQNLLIENGEKLVNIKEIFTNSPENFHTLKMLKRHFYVNITSNSLKNVHQNLSVVIDKLRQTYQGLQGKMDFEVDSDDGFMPNQYRSNRYKGPTYFFGLHQGKWRVSYFDGSVKKMDIDPNDIGQDLLKINSVKQFRNNRLYYMKILKTYHSKRMDITAKNVYISDLPKSMKNDNKNKAVGFVYGTALNISSSECYGAIHLDYRLMCNPNLMVKTLIHEAGHRFAGVSDVGYYHDKKAVKNSNCQRPYPRFPEHAYNQMTNAALANADTYAFFTHDLILADKSALNQRLQEKYLIEKNKDFPEQIQTKISSPSPYSFFKVGAGIAVGALVAGGIAYAYYGTRSSHS